MVKVFSLILFFVFAASPCFGALAGGYTLQATGWPHPACGVGASFSIAEKSFVVPGYGTGSWTAAITSSTGNSTADFTITNPSASARMYLITSNAYCEQSYFRVTAFYSTCPAIPDKPEVSYKPDGLTCQDYSYDHQACSWVPIDMPSAYACCSNEIRDGMEWAINQGGACDAVKGNTCSAGQVLFTTNGGNWCGLPNNNSEAECDGSGPEWGFPLFWSTSSSKCLEISANVPTYEPPVEATDLIAGVNDTNKILSDLINASNANTDGIIRAINTNSDVTNGTSGKIVAAIVDSKSAIVAAINAKNFNPTINVAAPSVSVSSPSVTVDTSSTNAAITAAASQAGQDSAALGNKVDALTAAILGQAPGGTADLSGVESRLDALNTKMTGPVGGAVAPVGDFDGTGDKVGRFEARFAAFRNTLKNSPLIDSVSGVFDFPSGGGGLSSSAISMGSYGSYTMDLSPVQSGLNMFGILVVGAACIVGGRVILIKG